MSKIYDDYLNEATITEPGGSLVTSARYYPISFTNQMLPIWFSPEDSWVGHICLLSVGDGTGSDWPKFECVRQSDCQDFTDLGYNPHSSVPLGRAVVCRVLGIRRELFENCAIYPKDERHLNCTRSNIMVALPDDDLSINALPLYALAKATDEYGIYVRDNLDRLFRMARRFTNE